MILNCIVFFQRIFAHKFKFFLFIFFPQQFDFKSSNFKTNVIKLSKLQNAP
jgi:hypothetical protein